MVEVFFNDGKFENLALNSQFDLRGEDDLALSRVGHDLYLGGVPDGV